MKNYFWIFITTIVVCLLTVPALWANDSVETFGDWNVQTYKEGGGQVCLMWSQPKQSKGNYTRRGDVYAYVTQRPIIKQFNEVSISIGYPFKKKSKLFIYIGDQKFSMFSEGDMAWNNHSKNDNRMVKAMQRGVKMTANGISRRGTKTTDVFSLTGFTKAFFATKRLCKIGGA